MSCRICGDDGHNSRSCPHKAKQTDQEKNRNHALWVKFDNVSEKDADELLKEIIDVKREIAPHARAVYAKADKKQLPNQIRKVLQLPKADNNNDE